MYQCCIATYKCKGNKHDCMPHFTCTTKQNTFFSNDAENSTLLGMLSGVTGAYTT